MKENSMKEDIERIKQRIEDVKEYLEYGLPYNEYLDLENSFDHILSDYKRVLKENEELKSSNKKLERANKCYINSIHSIVPVLNQDYIEKQKIKDKIEELNEYYKKEIYPERFNWADVNITEYYDGMIDILQDLLEEKGE